MLHVVCSATPGGEMETVSLVEAARAGRIRSGDIRWLNHACFSEILDHKVSLSA